MTDRHESLQHGTSSHDRLPGSAVRDAPIVTERRESADASPGWVRPVLWVLLIVSLSANVITQTMDLHALISGAFGLSALTAIAGLVVHHYRHRRS